MAVDVDVGGGRGGVVEAYLFFALLLECNKIFNAQAGTGGGGGDGGVVEYTRATSVSVITWPGGFFCCCFFIIGEKKTTVKKKKKLWSSSQAGIQSSSKARGILKNICWFYLFYNIILGWQTDC